MTPISSSGPDAGSPSSAPERRLDCRWHVTFAFELSTAIDLDRCAELLAETSRQKVPGSARVPQYFDYAPPPLRIPGGAIILTIGGAPVESVEIVLYDFGAAAVTYQLPMAASITTLITMSEALQGNQALEVDARARLSALLPRLAAAMIRPRLATIVEDYVTLVIDPKTIGDPPGEFFRANKPLLARLLRPTALSLAPDEEEEALKERLSFSLADLTVVDWNVAIVIDREFEASIQLFEFANVQLVELRHLDAELDSALDSAYGAVLGTERKAFQSLRPPLAEMRKVGELEMDAAVLYERVSSAVKLVGDQFLGRLYLALSRRLHFDEWDQPITRKLSVIEGIYRKMSDRVSTRRLEVLEWIVIVLIAIELVLGVFH